MARKAHTCGDVHVARAYAPNAGPLWHSNTPFCQAPHDRRAFDCHAPPVAAACCGLSWKSRHSHCTRAVCRPCAPSPHSHPRAVPAPALYSRPNESCPRPHINQCRVRAAYAPGEARNQGGRSRARVCRARSARQAWRGRGGGRGCGRWKRCSRERGGQMVEWLRRWARHWLSRWPGTRARRWRASQASAVGRGAPQGRLC